MDSWHSFVFCSFSFTESYKQPHDGIKVSHSPNFTILQRPGSQFFFSVIGGPHTQLIVSSTFGYVSKNEMPSRFEKMVQWAFHFSNCPPPPPSSFFHATWKIPTKFNGKKGNTNWSMSLHSVKLLAESFTVHTYVWLYCL